VRYCVKGLCYVKLHVEQPVAYLGSLYNLVQDVYVVEASSTFGTVLS
jgi:hypothetical protein